MSIYQMRTYHLASESAVPDYLAIWAAHVSSLAEFDVVTHGFSPVPGNSKAVVALVSFQDEVDPDTVIRDYMNSDGFRNDMANFDMSQIEQVDTLLLAPLSAAEGSQTMTSRRGAKDVGRLEGKVALITGGARGQGEAEARRFAREGALVYLCDVLSEQGETLAADIRAEGGSAQFKSLDVTDEDQWHRVIDEIDEEAGRLDILINNAGTNARRSLTDTTRETWDKILDVNLTGQFLGMQACAPLMQRTGGGSIVNLGSTAGIMGHPVAAYSSSKWGIRGITKAAAINFAPMGIRVNAMHPGVVETPMMDSTSRLFKNLVNMTPLGRAANSDEMAAAALFLASDDASFVTGIDLPVDGGFSELGTYGEIWNRINSH
ncbi:SDR family NAD(P)-dependent oxidoreductase [Streptomyces sp. NPDC004296]|uniref:SDR family NAD(P)-dependent oxidoreductase n=1 Tax=Streptomyces sp. NPDC004296 TaxID=3364697 RepID=UPI00369D7A3A